MPDSTPYPLSGFGQGFGLRAFNLQSTVPDFWVCGFCGVIPSTVVALPCLHSVCEACFAQCTIGDKLCPLDQTPVEGDEHRVPFSLKQLSTLKATCWNAPNGCSFSGSCAAVLDHFDKDCDFHVVSCSRCNHKVLRGDIVAHLKPSCADRVIQDACSETSELLHPRHEDSNSEIKELIEKVKDDVNLHLQTSFNELSELVHSGKARTQQSYEMLVSKVVPRVEVIRAIQVKCPITELLQNRVWESGHQSLSGYCVSLSLTCYYEGGYEALTVSLNINWGPLDEELEWPFRKGLVAGLIYTPRTTQRLIEVTDATEGSTSLCKPTLSSSPSIRVFGTYVEWVKRCKYIDFYGNMNLFVEVKS